MGLIFGENPRQGFFRQNQFLHPDLKFQLDFPSGWKTQNTMTAVIGVSGQQDAMMALELAGNTSPSQGLSEFFRQQGVQSQGTFDQPDQRNAGGQRRIHRADAAGDSCPGCVSYLAVRRQTRTG